MDAFLPATSFDAGRANALQALSKSATSQRGSSDIDKTAKEFERMALAQMLSMMETATDMSDSMFGGGAAERAFKPMLTEEYARGFAQNGGIGLGDAVRREMLRMQEVMQNGKTGGA
jgi:peptidoglycan hydrolase FlgJ